MSIMVMAPVLRATFPAVDGTGPDHKGTSPQTLKLVALCLADCANDDGTDAHPGIRTIARWAQCHTATAVRALEVLCELGAISRVERGGGRRRAAYDVHVGWFVSRIAAEADVRTCPPIARTRRAHQRAPQARTLRAPEARANARPRGALLRPSRPYVPDPVVVDDDDDARRPTPPPWIAEGISYGTWIRRERAAGRLPRHNPPRP